MYKNMLNTYVSDTPCLMGKYQMFSQYLEEFAKGREGYGLDLGVGPQGWYGKYFTSAQTLDACDIEEEVL